MEELETPTVHNHLNDLYVIPMPTRWDFAARLVQDAACQGFGPVTLTSDGMWTLVFAEPGWVEDWYGKLVQRLPPGAGLGRFVTRPQVWLYLVDGCVALRKKGSTWHAVVGDDVPPEPRREWQGLDSLAIRGMPRRQPSGWTPWRE